MNDTTGAGQQQDQTYLPRIPWDVDRWFQSDTYLGAPLAVQGAYLNLCFAAFRAQPACALSDRDEVLWRLAGASSLDEWLGIKQLVLSGPWKLTEHGWIHEVVSETYATVAGLCRVRRRAAHIAGLTSARVRRAAAKMLKRQPHRTTVERPSEKRAQVEEEVEGEERTMREELPLDPFREKEPPTRVGAAAPEQDQSALFPRTKAARTSKVPTAIEQLALRVSDEYVALFNELFKRRVSATPGIRDAVTAAMVGGYSRDDLLCATVAASQDPWIKERNADKSLVPEWLLRFKGGTNNQTGKQAKKWLEDELARVEFVVLTPTLWEITERHGVKDELLRRGARVPSGGGPPRGVTSDQGR